MTLLTRYVTTSFIRYFILSLLSVSGLFLLVELFESLRIFMEYETSFSDGFMMIAAKLPWIATQTLPLSALMGALIALSLMARSGELTVLRSAGIPLTKLAMPLLFCGIFIAAFTYLLQEQVVPHASSLSREIKNVRIRGRVAEKMLRSSDVWFRSGDAFVHADLITGDRRGMKNVQIYEVKDSSVPRTILAPEAVWEDGRWLLLDALEVNTGVRGRWKMEEREGMPYPLAPPPEEIYISRNMTTEQNMAELKKTIKSQRAQALNVTNIEVDFWAKTSLPFSCILMPLIAVPFASRVSGREGLWGAVSKGIGVGLLYYLLFMLSTSIGRTGSIPPPIAAWLPNVVFAALCIHLLVKAEKGR